MAVSFIGGEKRSTRRKRLTCHKSLFTPSLLLQINKEHKWNCECNIDDDEMMELNTQTPLTEKDAIKLDSATETNENSYKRATWTRNADFILSIIGYSVGVSNILRLPYLCVRNGGGKMLYWRSALYLSKYYFMLTISAFWLKSHLTLASLDWYVAAWEIWRNHITGHMGVTPCHEY